MAIRGTARGWFAGLIALVIAPAAPASADWHQARSAHFVVYADDKPERLRAFATKLERFDRALRVLFSKDDDGGSSSRRLTVYVVDDTGDVAKLAGKGQSGTAGFYLPRATGAVAFVPRQGVGEGQLGLSAQTVLLHEYAHHFMISSWPNLAFPAWYTEGFAEFAATALFNKDGGITVGAAPLYRAREILSPTMSLKQIIAADISALPLHKKIEIYGRGWLLTHYLMLSSERRSLLSAYVKALNSGKSTIEAAAVFGDLGALDKLLNRYAANRLSGFVLQPDKLGIGAIEVTPLSPGAAAVMPALLRSTRGVDRVTAPAVYALADKLAAPYPQDPAVQAVLAEAAHDARQYDAAKAAADRAIAADPRAFNALIYQGRTAMAVALRDGITDPARWTAVRRAFLAANKIDVENAEALLLFYQSFMAAGQSPTKNAQDALEYAYELAPFDPGLRMTAANMFLNQGNAAAARVALGPVAFSPHGGPLAEVASATIDVLDKSGPKAALAFMTRSRSSNPLGDDGQNGATAPHDKNKDTNTKPGGAEKAKAGSPASD